MYNTIKTIFIAISFASISYQAAAQAPNTAVGTTTKIVKPIPKEMLKNLTITFDDKGKPIFTLKKQLKSIQCDPSTAHGKKTKTNNLPSCQITPHETSPQKSLTTQSAADQSTDTVCYTIEWVEDGVVYTYTFCYDTSSTN